MGSERKQTKIEARNRGDHRQPGVWTPQVRDGERERDVSFWDIYVEFVSCGFSF